jgi:sodium/proline symporter
VGGSIIVLYTLLGGFFAVAWTDFLQGLIMAASMLLMPLLALVAVGGYGRLLESLAALDPNLVTLSGGRSGGALFGFVVGLVGIGLGYPGQPHVLTRYMAAADGEKIRKTQLIAMLWGIVVFYGAGMLGLAGRVLMPDLADPEKLFPLLSRAMLHPVLAGVMLAAILSAIMSTVSSQLLVAASTLSRDLLEKVLGVCTTPRAALSAGRLTVLVLGILAMIVALQDVRVVFWFVLFAWSGLGAAFGPVLLLALSTRLVTVPGAVAGILTGFGVTVLWKQLGASETIIYEMVPAFLLSTLAVLGVSLLTRARPTRI